MMILQTLNQLRISACIMEHATAAVTMFLVGKLITEMWVFGQLVGMVREDQQWVCSARAPLYYRIAQSSGRGSENKGKFKE